jgi:UDP-glucose 4-epimerase
MQHVDRTLSEFYKNKIALITGGLGFLGSNLAHKLVGLESKVIVIDNLNPLYGGNKFNTDTLSDRIEIHIADVLDESIMSPLIERADIIFHFAAQVSYIDSISMPHVDYDLNARSTLKILELCRKLNRKPKIAFSSSRMVLGKVDGPKMSELSSTNPLSLYGIHKLTSEKYLSMYYDDFSIPSVVFRITNPYGPRQQIKHSKYSLVGWFIRQAMENQTINIFGNGEQTRDYIYVDDIINGIIKTVSRDEADGEIFNMGSGVCTKFKDMVETVVRIVGGGEIHYTPWPANYERIETGDAVADISKLSTLTGFSPSINLTDGITRTYEYFLKNREFYI